MLRRVRRWVAARLASGEDEDTAESENSRFVPSVLDASVRYAHGQSQTGLDKEIADIEDEARRLEDQRHN